MTNEVVRVAFALVPGPTQFKAIIEASQRITDYYHNDNIIDVHRFPPHVSVHICTLPAACLGVLPVRLAEVAKQTSLSPVLDPAEVAKGTNGYITVPVALTPDLRALHEQIIALAAELRAGLDEAPNHTRPLPKGGTTNFERYGNAFVLDAFDPHFSVAKVDRDDQVAAWEIARDVLSGLTPELSATFQVCDIGMRNERWELLTEHRAAAS